MGGEPIDSMEPSAEILGEIDRCREKILQKEFGPKIPEERMMAVKKEVRARLDAAPEDTLGFLRSFPGKEPVRLFIPGTDPAEFFTVTLDRRYQELTTKDEVRVYREFVTPIIEFGSNGEPKESLTRTAATDEDLGFMMLGEPTDDTPVIWVNLFHRVDEMERINVDFVGECEVNGIQQDQMKNLSDKQKIRMGMYTDSFFLAARELRENPHDQMALGLVEQALKIGEKISIEELHARSEALNSR